MQNINCNFCSAPSDMICYRCRDPYCSVECQLNDWPRHRLICMEIPKLIRRPAFLTPFSSNPLDFKSNSCQPSPKAESETGIEFSKLSLNTMAPRNGTTPSSNEPKTVTAFSSNEMEIKVLKNPPNFKNRSEAYDKFRQSIENIRPLKATTQTNKKSPEETVKEQEPVTQKPPEIPSRSSRLLKYLKVQSIEEKKVWKETVNLKENSNLVVIIQSFSVETKIAYVVLLEDMNERESLIKEANRSAGLKLPPELAQIEVGDLYLVQHDDKNYYRGEVLDKISDDSFKLRLIDVGEELTASVLRLREVPALFKSKPAFAFQILIENSDGPLDKNKKITVQITGDHDKTVKKCKIVKVKKTGIISAYTTNGLNQFEAKLSYILTENWMTARVKLAPKIEKLPELIENAMKEIKSFESTAEVKKGMVIAYEKGENTWIRSVVIDVDETVQGAVVYLCDYGSFESLVPIPKKVYIVPETAANIPSLAIFIRIDKILIKDQSSFHKKMLNQEEVVKYVVKEKKGSEKSYEAEAIVNNEPIATVTVFDEDPDLKLFGLDYWPIQSRPNTTVFIQSSRFDSKVHVTVHPSEKLGIFTGLLSKAFEISPPCTEPPKLNELVLYKRDKDAVIRCVVFRHSSKEIVELKDLDSFNMLQTSFTNLKMAPNFVCNLPVYTMQAILSDYDDYNPAQVELVQRFFDQKHLKNRELFLKYSGLPTEGVMLTVSSAGDSLVKKLREFIMNEIKKREDEEAMKQKLEEEKRKQQEDEKRKRIEEEEKRRLIEEEKRKQIEEEERKKIEEEKRKKVEEERKRLEQEAARKRSEEEDKRKRLEEEKRKQAEEESRKRAEEEERKRLEQEETRKRTEEEQARKRVEEEEKLKRLQEENRAKEKEKQATSSTSFPRIMYKDLGLVNLPVGKVCEILVIDKDVKNQTMGVIERSKANVQAFEEIINSVATYIESINVKDFAKYVPDPQEIVLAYYEELMEWCRACVLRNKKSSGAVVQLVDYGTLITTKQMVPLPEKLKEPTPRTHIATTNLTPEQFEAIEALKIYRYKVNSCEEGFCELEQV